ncbi:YrhC family protein [Fictibacillus aquaticus]|uniref:YrhC-like protein n=1 Tax=Fictibacillus aquaticus TaxID=2021314 RepID=A0A235F9Q5_9BACL|nr:YrhC family protein [Fictibacillus aquaticus]OYD58008.1 hypothetical protein CGZ90_08955 [Fictibacillus aquaticus]
MTQNEKQVIQQKVTDYQRFGIILLSLSAFLYLGLVLPMEGRDTMDSIFLGLSTLSLLAITSIMYFAAKKYKEILRDSE